MPMTPGAAVSLCKVYLPAWQKNRERVEYVDRWYRGALELKDKPQLPTSATTEYKGLRDRSMTPWLKFVVRSLAQGLYVEGYRRSDQPDNADAWQAWQRNGLDAHQIAVHRSAMAHGISYVTVLPGDPFPVIRGASARRTLAVYQDPTADEWPMYALRGDSITGADGVKRWRFRFYDDTAVYTLDAGGDLPDESTLKFVTLDEHDAGECPVVRFQNEPDLDGRSDGEVEPNIDLAARINQDTFDRQVVQRFGAWMVRYITGMAPPTTDAERAEAINLRIEDFLVTENADSKVGALPATPLDGYIKSGDADKRDLAVVTQVPPQDLLGQMVNLSAEALASAEASRNRKLLERKHTFGESWEQTNRMSAHLMGDADGAQDFDAQVQWRDVESRSLAQTADAFGKLVTMLNFPAELLWDKIPGLSMQDVQLAKQKVEEAGGITALLQGLAAGQESPPVP